MRGVRWVALAAWVGLTATTVAGPTSTGDLEPVAAELSQLCDELAETREGVAALQAELRRVRQEVNEKGAASLTRWKHEREELRRERLAFNREVQHLAHERAEVARVAAFHRARHPVPLPPEPGAPLILSNRDSRPRYAQPPGTTYVQPPVTYIQPPFFFDPFVTPNTCFGFPRSPLIFRFNFHD